MTDQTEPERFDLRSHTIADDKQAQLLSLFPEIATEGGKIDFDRLKLALGEMVDVGRERYGMNWPGKADCFKTIQAPSLGTLLPVPEESVNWDTTENLIIEGDNLEVLKLLQKSYLGKVKLIYIDPPYNTGNDFVYPDNYSEGLQTYLEYTGQADAEGRRFGTNPDTDGRFHSRWLNMMFPRLYLARNLLSNNGSVFISCDDNEVQSLRALCNEIFGEDNFVATIIWQKRYSRENRGAIGDAHDYIVVYAKSAIAFEESRNLIPMTEEQAAVYKNPNDDPSGRWRAVPMTAQGFRPNQMYEIVTPSGEKHLPPEGRCWSMVESEFKKLLEAGRIYFGKDGSAQPGVIRYLSEVEGIVPWTWWPSSEVGHTDEARKEIREIFGSQTVYDTPKPTRLLERIVQIGSASGDLILDFFAGSGTTGAAVFRQNVLDRGNRRFILVQLPEPTGRDDYPTISSITRDRARRVGSALSAEEEEGSVTADPTKDRGFRSLHLSESNFSPWKADDARDASSLGGQLDLHVRHIRQGRTAQDLLFEILIKDGFPPTTAVEEVQLAGKRVFSAAADSLLVCLERELTLELIRELAERKPERVVLLDEGFAGKDQLKANAVKLFESKGVVRFRTV